MSDDVKGSTGATRAYRSTRRAEQAAATRRAILSAAGDLFVRNGYANTTIAEVAGRASVSVDTVYAAVGRKPDLLRELVETAISGMDHAVPPEQRDYVIGIRATPGAADKLRLFAEATVAIQQRMASVFLALRDAATTDADCAELWRQISQRRALNMRQLASELRATGELRDELTIDDVADIVWSTNGAEFWDLLVRQRGWEPARFARWLGDSWARLLLEPGDRRSSR